MWQKNGDDAAPKSLLSSIKREGKQKRRSVVTLASAINFFSNQSVIGRQGGQGRRGSRVSVKFRPAVPQAWEVPAAVASQ